MNDAGDLTQFVRSLPSGQITIPAAFRKELGIGEGTLLQLTLARGELRIRPVASGEQPELPAGSPWLKELYDLFEPVRQTAARYSEAEVNADIERAVNAVRRAHA